MRYEDQPTEGNNGDPDSYAEPDFETTEAETDLGLYEATRRVNVRRAPSTTAPIVRVLEAGDRVPVAAIESGWAKLADTDDGGAELVKIDYLKEQS